MYKSDIKTNKDRFGAAKYFNGKCKSNSNIFQFLSVQIIELVYGNATDIEDVLWHREKYWQSQLFTLTNEMNSVTTSTVPNVRDIGNKFLQQILFS